MRNRIANAKLFASRQEETDAMLSLRREMYTNHEIARKLGVAPSTVYHRIGVQPETITKMSVTLRNKARTDKIEARQTLAAKVRVEEYNRVVTAANALLTQYAAVLKNLRSLKKQAVKASQTSGTPLARLTKAG